MEQNQKARHLASVQQIVDIQPIENADSIELARVLGWNVVIRKGQFKIGDPVVYYEIDSVLPKISDFEFLKDKHYKVKTCRLRGAISQGLCTPLSILPEGHYDLGDDVTEILGVTKYEKPIPVQLRGRVRGNFPRGIPKTEELRVQSIPDIVQKYQGYTFTLTEKLNGTSATYFLDEDTGLHCCSRNLDLAPDFEHKFNGTAYWTLAEKLNVEEIIKTLGKDVVLQGEIIGNGINGNQYKLNDIQFKIFNLYDKKNHMYFDQYVLNDTIDSFGFPKDWFVPYLGELTLNHNVDQIVEMAYGRSLINPDVIREGLVFRASPEVIDPFVGRVSWKVISPTFNLEYKE
jgi:RNA ligase (TIGR02306 family)